MFEIEPEPAGADEREAILAALEVPAQEESGWAGAALLEAVDAPEPEP